MNPDEMASLLTEYFTEMVECVFRHGGTPDKFMATRDGAVGRAARHDDDADSAMPAGDRHDARDETLNSAEAVEGARGSRSASAELRRGVRGEHRLGAPARVHVSATR
jgi:adenylate cyclase